jgi:hypothetical protein
MDRVKLHTTLKIGIIDSGIDISNKRLMRFVKRGINITDNDEKTISSIDDKIGHGTACIDLITRYLDNSHISIYVYKVFDNERSADIEIFERALEAAFTDDVDILNCSVGTIVPEAQYRLKSYVESLLQRDTIIVSSWNDEGYTTWPANFPGVISVKSGTQTSQSEWGWEDNKRGHVIFRGKKQRVQWKNNKTVFIGGSSFATALCTRNIVEQLIPHRIQKNYASVESLFKNGAAFTHQIDLNPSSIIRWNDFSQKVKYVGLYPFNKEMHAFARFRKDLPYGIGWIADLHRSKNAGRFTNEVLENCNESIFVQKGLPDDPGDIDTIVVGYLDKASELQKTDLLDRTLQYALAHNINAFTFLPPSEEKDWKNKYLSSSLSLDVPRITYTDAIDIIENVPENKAFDTPILGIFGTSSKQGKFTLQLKLRCELEKKRFRIGQIGTEHHSGCFGMDFTFPSGYGAHYSLQIPYDFHIPVLRRVLSEMDKGQYDLIIVGAQSGLINPNPYYYGCIFSELFFTATVPDRTIIIFNRSDSPELLRRTEQYIYSKTGQPVFHKICSEELFDQQCWEETISSVVYDIINS